jgi:hypothetical protein
MIISSLRVCTLHLRVSSAHGKLNFLVVHKNGYLIRALAIVNLVTLSSEERLKQVQAIILRLN